MEKEFVPYQPSLHMKELGFDEPCFGYYKPNGNLKYVESHIVKDLPYLAKNSEWQDLVAAPLYQQALRWLRKEHNCVCEIIRKEVGNHSEFIGWVYIDDRKIDVASYWDSKSYEEAELQCLNKLIELIKQK